MCVRACTPVCVRACLCVCVCVRACVILVMSRTPEEHEQHLRIVLQILRENGLKAKLIKCESNKAELHFLGQVMEKTVLHWIP